MGEAKRRKEKDPNYGQHRDVWDLRPDQSQGLFDNLPPDTTEDDYLKYLDRHWDAFAAFAYESFLSEGKGFLLVDWDLSLDARLSLLSPDLRSINQRERRQAIAQGRKGEIQHPALYVGERGVLFPLMQESGLIDDRWLKMLDRYDPELMIILALSWGNTAEEAGAMMVRTLGQANRKSPVQSYIENGRSSEFVFWAGTNESVRPLAEDRAVRQLQVEIQSNPKFRSTLRQAFDAGYGQHGKGAVVVISIGNGGVQPIFVPAADLARALGANISDRSFQQAIAIMDACDPETQIAAILTSEITGESFMYYAVLLGIPKEADRTP